jgi:hypothetical protein
MMNENEMEYRGSKSNLEKKFVKEQRVDGSYWIKPNQIPIQLRCTLMGREIFYQLKILSKQLNKRTFSTFASQLKINPWFVTGFSDAEGSFIISIYRDEKSKLN